MHVSAVEDDFTGVFLWLGQHLVEQAVHVFDLDHGNGLIPAAGAAHAAPAA